MGLPFCGRRTVHNTNLLEKWLFSIIYCVKNIDSISMKFSGFVNLVKGYCCATELFNMFKIELENRDFCKSLYFYKVDAEKKRKKKRKKSCVWVLALN